jgi:hypothetical protein
MLPFTTKAWTNLSRTAAGRRCMTTATDAAGGGAGTGALAAAAGTTFVTYVIADFLSNFLQHPTQLVGEHYVNSRLCMRLQ